MPAAAVALPSETSPELIDFLRRLASMMAGGRNAEMLLEAATTIETLTRRATTAEQLFNDQKEDHAKNLEMRQVAELAADNLIAEIAALKAQLAESEQKAEAEITALKAEIADSRAQAEQNRATFSEEALRLQAVAQEMQLQLAGANATIEELRNPDK